MEAAKAELSARVASLESAGAGASAEASERAVTLERERTELEEALAGVREECEQVIAWWWTGVRLLEF